MSSGSKLRSQQWFRKSTSSFGHRSRMLQNGFDLEEFVDRPVIGIINTWSGLSTCHGHLREIAEVVSLGVLQAGGFPVELPVMSLPEMLTKPTAMVYRNLLAMEVEELLKSHPIDGVVLLGGCDKTTPALLMAAASVDLPSIYVPAGYMLHGLWRGQRLGSGVDAWTYGPKLKMGEIDLAQWYEIEQGSARTVGTCNTMGTASTMTAVAEALGMTLPMASSLPAVDAGLRRLAREAGTRIVAMVEEELTPSQVMTSAAFRNAATVNFALGGSTNAAIHLLAMAGRLKGVALDLKTLDSIARTVPVIANILPSGTWLMEDFYEAGGLPALMSTLRDRLDLSCRTVSGRSLGDQLEGVPVHNAEVIRPLANPVGQSAFATLYGNLAPNGCVIKPSAASPHLLRHRGRAVVFDGYDDLKSRINDPELDVDDDGVLVLRNGGPLGGPGMPEWGMLPIPKKLLAKGVRDMVRISDARMSGTSFGTVVLHVSPESHLGGPLAIVRTGDMIELDVPARSISLCVSPEEIADRLAAWSPPARAPARGYETLFAQHVTQAHEGCDFEFLRADGEG